VKDPLLDKAKTAIGHLKSLIVRSIRDVEKLLVTLANSSDSLLTLAARRASNAIRIESKP
jgi:hypothetical protein